MAWSIEAVEKTAKKYPWLVYGGLAAAVGGGIYYLVKSRQGETGIAYAPGYPQEAPAEVPAGTSPQDLQVIEDLLNQLLWEQRQAGAAYLQELQGGLESMRSSLMEMYSQYLSQLPPAGAPAQVTYVSQPSPAGQAAVSQPVQPTVSQAVQLPPSLAGTERLYTQPQAKTILEWVEMETIAQQSGYAGTSALPSGLAESGLRVVYHPTGYVEFVPAGEKPSPTPASQPGLPGYDYYAGTEAERLGSAIASLQKSYAETTTPEVKEWYHQKAEELRQQAISKGISQEVEKARLSAWAQM